MASMEFPDTHVLRQLAGDSCSHLKILEEHIGVRLALKGNTIELMGEDYDIELARHVLSDLYKLLKEGFPLYPSDVWYAVRMLAKDRTINLQDVFMDTIYISSTKKVVMPKSLQQKLYIDAMRDKDVVFGIGPAGTGKTYLAVAMAVSFLKVGAIQRIVLVRPAVEAGEKLGFLPGDMQAKVNPYLRPLFDAMHDMMSYDQIKRFIANDVVEVAPLAFMRGRTLNNSLIILDEAQNTTCSQMLMFLTRLGNHSKMIVTGDDSQIDLEKPETSGFTDALRRLKDMQDIAIVRLQRCDIVRHPLVQNIVNAYANERYR